MRNPFVDYLNTLHNADGANANALAESQAVNPFYDSILVHRRIGEHIASLLEGNAHCIILTGHAGDGKTGLLHQILLKLKIAEESKPLERDAMVLIPNTSRTLLYAKDMSELSDSQQEALLRRALQAPQDGNSSILVSNTGPLLNTFKRLQESGDPPGGFRELQSELLAAMDATEPMKIRLNGYEFTIVNMARINNVGMAALLLQKITNEELWSHCQSCPVRDMCPILNNVSTIRTNFTRTTHFIETYLTWLQENDDRLTLRQILAQLAYGITGNLSCEEVHSHWHTRWSLFKYHFANSFWGFHGIEDAPSSAQVRGIRAIRELQLDETATPDDYAIFVQQDLLMFDERTRELVDGILSGRIFPEPPAETGVANSGIRRSVRRLLFLFASGQSQEEYNQLLETLFSPVLPVYARFLRGDYSRDDVRSVQGWIARGLYRSIVGVPRPDDGDFRDRVHVTIRPDRPGITGVQLLLGELSDDDLEIVAPHVETFGDFIDNRQSHVLVMKLRNTRDEDKYVISLPLLDYLYRLGEGAISTRLNPYLSHGIDTIKAALADYVQNASREEVRLLILTTEGPKKVELSLESGRLVVR